MRTRHTPLLALLALLLPSGAHAYFEQVETGARAVAMGRAFVAVADDPSAVYWNPAGLASPAQSRQSILLHYAKPFVVTGLNAVDGMWQRSFGSAAVGVGWHHLGVTDIVSEDIWTVSYAQRLPLAIDVVPLRDVTAGASVKVARVGFSDFVDASFGSETRLALDLGVQASIGDQWRAGYAVRNLGEPEFDLVEGGGGSKLFTNQSVGASFRWNRESILSFEATDADDEFVFRFGGEVRFYDVLALRSGFFGNEYSGGMGILSEAWALNMAFRTNRELGISYRVELLLPLGGRP